MSELLPCPFCGGEAEDYDSDFGNGIYCMGCGAMVGEPIHLDYRVDERITYEQAAAAWNTRTERTCRITGETYDYLLEYTATRFSCGHCAIGPARWFKYCPECGARVEEV